jgi:hypothetical protein
MLSNKFTPAELAQWRQNNHSGDPNFDKKHRYQKTFSGMVRDGAVRRVGRGSLVCVKCGSPYMIQINHKFLEGSKEIRELGSSYKFYKNINDGTRSIDDLELTCMLCNWNHYVRNVKGYIYYVQFAGEDESILHKDATALREEWKKRNKLLFNPY